MAQEVCIVLGEDDSRRLQRIVADRNTAQKHGCRARVVLESTPGRTVKAVAEAAGVSRPAVWRWQVRFAEEGVEGLLRDKTRPPGRVPLSGGTVRHIIKFLSVRWHTLMIL